MYHLDANGGDGQELAEGGGELVDPGAYGGDYGVGLYEAALGLDGGDAASGGLDFGDGGLGEDFSAVVAGLVGVGVGGGHGVGVAGVGFIDSEGYAVEVGLGDYLGYFGGGSGMDFDSEFAVHFDVGAGGVGVALSEEEYAACLDEAGVAANGVAEVVEDVAGFHGHPDEGWVEVVFADHGSGAAAGAAGEVASFDEDDLARAHPGEVHGDAGSVDASADDDDVCGCLGHGFLSV